MAKPLLCLLGWHKWKTRVNDSGERFAVCARCGKEDVGGISKPPLGA